MDARAGTPARLFERSMGHGDAWEVADVWFEPHEGADELHVGVARRRGAAVPCPACGAPCGVHDSRERAWRHLDFWQHGTIVHCAVPRADCPEHGVRTVRTPWEVRPNSHLAALFEAQVIAAVMPSATASAVTPRLREADGRAWAVLRRAVAEARQAADHSGVARVGVDDTSRARRRTHISVMADLDARRVVAVTDGRARRGEPMADRGCRPRRLARPAPPEVEARVADARTRLPRRRSRWPPRCPGLRTARLTCRRRPGGRPRPSPARPWAPRPTGSAGPRAAAGTAVTSA